MEIVNTGYSKTSGPNTAPLTVFFHIDFFTNGDLLYYSKTFFCALLHA